MYKRKNHSWLKHMDFILWDVLVLQVSLVMAFLIRQGLKNPYADSGYRTLAIVLILFDVLIAAIFNTMHNVLKRRFYNEVIQSLKQVLMVYALSIVFLFIMHTSDIYSRIVLSLTMVFHFAIGIAVRSWWKKIVVRIERPKGSMILVADERRIPEILGKKKELDDFDYCGIILTNRDGSGEVIEGVQVVSNLMSAADYICREWVDEIFICPDEFGDLDEDPNHPTREQGSLTAFIQQCREMALPVHIELPFEYIGGRSFLETVGGYNVVTMTLNYASPLQLALKRIMDVFGGIVGSLAALLIIIIVGPIIKKESPGPILFKQTRIGKNGKKFQIYKIRSMYMDAESRKKELMKDNRISDGMMFKLDWDPRIIGNKVIDGKKVTGIGEFIRSHSLDEFPQFFNVLLSQMSLVGTRPPTIDEWEKYKYHHRARLSTKPGITGMWQVSGRSDITDFEEVVKLDTEYINNWTLMLDIKILFKTIKAVLKRDGAM